MNRDRITIQIQKIQVRELIESLSFYEAEMTSLIQRLQLTRIKVTELETKLEKVKSLKAYIQQKQIDHDNKSKEDSSEKES